MATQRQGHSQPPLPSPPAATAPHTISSLLQGTQAPSKKSPPRSSMSLPSPRATAPHGRDSSVTRTTLCTAKNSCLQNPFHGTTRASTGNAGQGAGTASLSIPWPSPLASRSTCQPTRERQWSMTSSHTLEEQQGLRLLFCCAGVPPWLLCKGPGLQQLPTSPLSSTTRFAWP